MSRYSRAATFCCTMPRAKQATLGPEKRGVMTKGAGQAEGQTHGLGQVAGEFNITFELFQGVNEALAWLDIPDEAGKSVIAQI